MEVVQQNKLILNHLYRKCKLTSVNWGLSSAGRAFALQAKCQGFESPRLHKRVHSLILETIKLHYGAGQHVQFGRGVYRMTRLHKYILVISSTSSVGQNAAFGYGDATTDYKKAISQTVGLNSGFDSLCGTMQRSAVRVCRARLSFLNFGFFLESSYIYNSKQFLLLWMNQ